MDQVDHVEAHLDGVDGVAGVRDRHPAHAVVAITQDLDPHTTSLLRLIDAKNYKCSHQLIYIQREKDKKRRMTKIISGGENYFFL